MGHDDRLKSERREFTSSPKSSSLAPTACSTSPDDSSESPVNEVQAALQRGLRDLSSSADAFKLQQTIFEQNSTSSSSLLETLIATELARKSTLIQFIEPVQTSFQLGYTLQSPKQELHQSMIVPLHLFEQHNISDTCREQLRRLADYSPPSHTLSTPLIVLCCIPVFIIILLTVFGNLLVLFFKARVGRTNTTLLVWNLGLTDFLVGVIVLPLGAFHLAYRKWIFGRFLCRVWVAADVTFCTCSVVTICVISVDRYLAVTRPLRYKSLVTKTKVILVMIIIWTFSSSILLTTVRWEQPQCYDDSICFAGNEIRYLAHSVVFAFFLPASVTLTLYWRIYKLARNRQRALDRGFLMILGHNMNFLSNTISQQVLPTSQNTLRVHFGKNSGMVEHQRRVLRTHERIAKTLGVVSCSFLFCWLPFFSLYLTNYKCHGCISPIAIDLASWLGYCNSMLNPIIYSFTVREFKRSALRIVIPTWLFAHRCLPKLIPSPPENMAQRMSRHGRRARNKTRHRSFELDSKKAALSKRNGQKRRQTEPAVFILQKKVSDAAAGVMIIEEDEDAAQDDTTDSNGFSTFHESSRRLSDLPQTILLPIAEMSEVASSANGECKTCPNDNDCSVQVICDTLEADL